MKNYLLSSLIPFIDDEEFAYYGQLDEDILEQLISLAPFTNSPENLRKLSKLSCKQLEKASEFLPSMDENEKENYFTQL